MSRFGSQYQVARPTGVCAATGEPLEPGAMCVATLCEHAEDEGFVRQDFSVEAWESGARPERLFSFWRTSVTPPEERRSMLVDDEVLMDIFHRLDGSTEPQRVAYRFVLALILMRKRLLRCVGRRAAVGDGPAGQLLRPPGASADDPPLAVDDPQLNDDDVLELTAQLGEILQGTL